MAGPTVPKSLSRRRPPPTGDEETTAILRLGEDATSHPLSVSETSLLLRKINTARLQPDANGNKPTPMPNTDVYTKTQVYLDLFSRFTEEQTVTQVELISKRLVDDGLITPFERAQLGKQVSAFDANDRYAEM